MQAELNSWIDAKSLKEDIVKYTINEKSILLTINNCSFELLLPTDKIKFMILKSADGKIHKWIDDLNMYCIQKSPKIKKVLDKILNFLSENKPIETTKMTLSDKSKEVDVMSIAIYREKNRLQDLSTTSVSPFKINARVKSIFSQTKIADMLINEYLQLFKTNSSKRNLSLIDNNLYHWKICYSDFPNKELNDSLKIVGSKFGYANIEVELMFDQTFYPNYPPVVRVVRPRLANSVMHRIANSKMFQLDYWDPTTSLELVVNRLYEILNKWGNVDSDTVLNDKDNHKFGAYLPIEEKLLKLANFINSDFNDEIDSDRVFTKLSVLTSLSTDKKKDVLKKANGLNGKAGIGYSDDYRDKWDINDYVQIQKEKDIKISSIIQDILKDIQNVSDADRAELYDSISCSLLIKFIKEQLKSTNLLDMTKHDDLFKSILELISNFCTNETIYLLNDTNDENNLYNVFSKLCKNAKMSLALDSTNEIANMIVTLHELLDPVYTEYFIKLESALSSKKTDKKSDVAKDIKDLYVTELENLKYDTCDIKKFYYKNVVSGSGVVHSHKRLSSEIPALAEDLPINYDASIFLRVNESNPSMMRALLTGPPDTPYENGCFIFDINIPDSYPKTCPEVHFMNTGGVRFNPNLYQCGKVCLSILGTYIGPSTHASERWDPATSTLFQVLISIQGQILVENPYFNEPGWQSSYGTKHGMDASESYDFNIKLYTMKHTILGLLRNPDSYAEFKDVFIKHFSHKKDHIIKTCKKWVDDAEKYYNKMSTALANTNYAKTESTYKPIYDDYQKTMDSIVLELSKF